MSLQKENILSPRAVKEQAPEQQSYSNICWKSNGGTALSFRKLQEIFIIIGTFTADSNVILNPI